MTDAARAHASAEWVEVVACTVRAALALRQLEDAISAYAEVKGG